MCEIKYLRKSLNRMHERKKFFFFSPKLKDHLVAGEGVGVCVVSPENQLPQADTSVGNQTKKKRGL